MEWFAIDGDRIYYISQGTNELFKYEQGLTVNMLPNKKISDIWLANGNFICLLEDGQDYSMIILDSGGNQVFKTADKIASVSIADNLVVYTTATNNCYKLQLTY